MASRMSALLSGKRGKTANASSDNSNGNSKGTSPSPTDPPAKAGSTSTTSSETSLSPERSRNSLLLIGSSPLGGDSGGRRSGSSNRNSRASSFADSIRSTSAAAAGGGGAAMLGARINGSQLPYSGARTLKSSPSLEFTGVTADGTPVVYDETTESNHSRSSTFVKDGSSIDDRSSERLVSNGEAPRIKAPQTGLPGRRATLTSPNSRARFDTSLPASTSDPRGNRLAAGGVTDAFAARVARSASLSASSRTPVGEGSLSLDAFVRDDDSHTSPDLSVTPKPQINIIDPSGAGDRDAASGTSLYVTSGSRRSPYDTLGERRDYPDVFEGSDMERTGSSSSGDSGIIDLTPGLTRPRIQVERESSPSRPPAPSSTTALSNASAGKGDTVTSPPRASTYPSSTLQPTSAGAIPGEGRSGTSGTRSRSGSTASATDAQPSQQPPPSASRTSFFSRSSSTSVPSMQRTDSESKVESAKARKASGSEKNKKKSSKDGKGIAGALALSGVALASPAPPLSQPLHLVGLQQDAAGPHTAATTVTGKTRRSTDASATSQQGAAPPSTSTRSSEDVPLSTYDYDSPTPISHYTPNDSPTGYDEDGHEIYHGMVSIDALGDFDDVVSQLGAGYALASSKRNAEFHQIFKNVPEDDYLIEDYGCALQREILIQGRLYISEHHLCFNANIFGWVTTVVLALSEIVNIEKRNTALVIPNAIHIATMHSRHTFASFISRDITYELIVSLWRNQHPVVPPGAALPDTAGTDEDDEAVLSNEDLEALAERQDTGRRKKKIKVKRASRFRRNKGNANADENEEGKGGNEADNDEGGDGEGYVDGDETVDGAARVDAPGKPRPGLLGTSQMSKHTNPTHPPTSCNCATGANGGHYPNQIMDAVFPGSPEKMYNLIFTSGFMKDFLVNDMKLSDLQIGDWAPQKSGSHLLTRTYNYIKPLSAPVGPKSAKCILVDENLHVDFDDFVVTLTTTRTPEVPSGGSFSVKTKTCIMWGKNNSARILVTSNIEWTGRSFIRSIIDKSSLEGQKQLYEALERSVRGYIKQHKYEFYEGDIDGTAQDGADEQAESREGGHARNASTGSGSGLDGGGEGALDRAGVISTTSAKDHFGFVTNAVPQLKPVVDFLCTLYDTITDILGQMSPTALICSFIIFVLLASNIFTLSSLRKKSSRYVPHRRPPPDYSSLSGSMDGGSSSSGGGGGLLGGSTHGSNAGAEVASAVRGVLQEYFNAHSQRSSQGTVSSGSANSPKEEIADIRRLLESLEKRVESLKASLDELD